MSDFKKHDVLSFKLTEEQASSIKALAGGCGVRISGYVDGNVVKIDNIAINAGVVGLSSAPMKDGMAPFIAVTAQWLRCLPSERSTSKGQIIQRILTK